MSRWTAAVGVVAAACLASGCAPERPPVDTPAARWTVPGEITVRTRDATVRAVPLEEYVQATVLAEFAPASGGAADVERMYEVQAVISRTYAVAHRGRHARDGYDLCATTHCQLYDPVRLQTSRWSAAAGAAARRTAAVVLWYGGAPARALFHADCGGHTSDAATVWGGAPLPYLRAVDDGDLAAAHATWRYDVEMNLLHAALNADRRTSVGARLAAISIVERDRAGRASLVRLEGDDTRVVRADVFRDVLSRAFGFRAIRSTYFEIRRDGNAFAFSGRGFGHGVGLCQAGALARIRGGASLQQVLHHYYPGTTLARLR
jgi:stage II sporulation protein D